MKEKQKKVKLRKGRNILGACHLGRFQKNFGSEQRETWERDAEKARKDADPLIGVQTSDGKAPTYDELKGDRCESCN
jgi:hypothetical protein